MAFQLSSPAFRDSGIIPARFTCVGENCNPELSWTDPPAGTKSFALIMDDPDVPRNLRPDGMFVHWLAWNIPATQHQIAEHSEPAGIIGLNTRGGIGYTGPCPPDRMHRYYFRVYALDTELTIASSVSKGELVAAMQGHVLAMAELMGRFEKPATNE